MKALLVAAALSTGLTLPLFAVAAAPTTRPSATSAPARTLIRISEPLAPDSKEQITAVVDITEAPEFKDWGIKAAHYALKWYPTLDKGLPSPNFTAPREFGIIIRPAKGVAYTSGTNITINTAYLKGHTDDLGMVAHELVHVIQHYRGRNPGWLVEGVADYMRYFVVEPGAKNARFNADRSDYKGGYQPAAAMLNFLEKQQPGIVVKFNQLMREGKFRQDTFQEWTGYEPDELWTEFKTSLKKPAK
jgi:acid phosphatase family membrane protein YuiD